MRWINRITNALSAAEEPRVDIVFNGGPFDGQVAKVPRGMMTPTPFRVRRYTRDAVLHWYASVGPWTGKRVLHLFHRGVAGGRCNP